MSLTAAVVGALALGTAVAAPIAQPEGGGGLVTRAKKEGRDKGGSGKRATDRKAGGGDRRHHSRRRHRDNGGGAILFGVAYCGIVAANCADQYGSGTRRYYWCVRDAGC
jgi:hypothetical protein